MNINNLIEYIEQNFRKTLYRMDFEILENISKQNYTELQIKQAVDYCKEQNVDSLRYLYKVLINMKQNETTISKNKWLDDENIKSEPLDKEDKKWAREFYYQFCDSKEEAMKKIIKLNLLED